MKADKQEIIKYAGWLGVALLVGGYMRYLVREELGAFDKSLLIAGAVLIVLSLALNIRAVRDVFSRRSTRLGTNTAALTVAVLAILAVVNFLGYRHHKRFDLTSESLYSLSDQTRKVVSGLKQDVKVIHFTTGGTPVADNLRETMTEFRNLSNRISYEQVNPEDRPQLAKRYEVRAPGETVVVSGERTEHLSSVNEQDLVSAILKVTREKNKAFCFIEGHGEKPLGGSGPDGYELINGALKSENYDTRTFNLATDQSIPQDCSVLVIASPKTEFLPPEVASIDKFLESGGKVLLMLDPETDPQMSSGLSKLGVTRDPAASFGDLLKKWNIVVGRETIIENNPTLRRAGLGMTSPILGDYGSHPITNGLRTPVLMRYARVVKVADPAKTDISATELIKSSQRSWGVVSLKGDEMTFNADSDTKGPLSAGVAASKKVGDKEARLVVIGDSDFASNGIVRTAGNADFILNTLSWLAQDEDLISIRPKAPTNRTISLTETQKNLIWLLTTIFLPALVIVTGGYIWWKRR
ncbi:MAG: Gldg family protein [Blastocatellia bacterium]